MSVTSHAVERGTVFESEVGANGLGFKRLTARIRALAAGAARRSAHRRARRDMLAISDHLLRDVGLTRAEIRFSVEHGRFADCP